VIGAANASALPNPMRVRYPAISSFFPITDSEITR
jgi:hypothetical protein